MVKSIIRSLCWVNGSGPYRMMNHSFPLRPMMPCIIIPKFSSLLPGTTVLKNTSCIATRRTRIDRHANSRELRVIIMPQRAVNRKAAAPVDDPVVA